MGKYLTRLNTQHKASTVNDLMLIGKQLQPLYTVHTTEELLYRVLYNKLLYTLYTLTTDCIYAHQLVCTRRKQHYSPTESATTNDVAMVREISMISVLSHDTVRWLQRQSVPVLSRQRSLVSTVGSLLPYGRITKQITERSG